MRWRIAWITSWVWLSAILIRAAIGLADDAPQVIPLWPNGVPGFEDRKDVKEVKTPQPDGEYKITNVNNPSLMVFLPPKDKATGTAVIVVPGGGYRELWPVHEGINEAKWLADRGVAALVLTYRLPREKDSPYKLPDAALQDGQRAMRLVRSRAQEWGINPKRIGMMGLSAGGEMTAFVCNTDGKGKPDSDDTIEKENARPDFQALVYSGPMGVKNQTITKQMNMPPTFLAVGDDDKNKDQILLANYYLALKAAGVPAELHIYAKTDHGFGFRDRDAGKPSHEFMQQFYEFLETEKLLDRKKASVN